MGTMSTRAKAWFAKPFSEDMDTINWLLFVGLIAVAVVLWTRILKTLEI